MNIYDISRIAGVSIATVSRVLNNSPSVSDKTRKKVLEVMEAEGYTPNAFARGLGLNSMQTIGLICTEASDIYQARAIHIVENLLRKHGYDTLLCCSGLSLKNKEKSVQLLLAKKVDALVLIGSSFVYEDPAKNEYIQQAGQRVPVMLLNAALDAPNVYGVLSDDFTAVYDATSRLIRSGLRDLLYYYNSVSYSGKRKLAGFRMAMEEHKLYKKDQSELLFLGAHEDIPGMAQQLFDTYQQGRRFQAVVTCHDGMALAVCKFARRVGLRIPEDLQIVGYNNLILSRCCDPELTSVDVHLEQLCHQLVTNLLQVLSDNEVAKEMLFPGELILRETTIL